MNVTEAIRQRRAIKHFDAGHVMSEEEQRTLLELAMQSPTAFNLQHWRFVVVADPAVRKQIRAAAWDQAQVTDASLLLVLCADLSVWKQPAPLWENAPEPVQAMMVPMIDTYYSGKPQVQRDEAMRSCGIAAQTIMLAAKSLGYDTCPMDGFDFDAVGEIIALPEHHVITMMIVVGKKTQDVWPKPGQLGYDQVVVRDRFQAA
ncbi:nitroreductase family protein [Massilia sp. H6]|uniref:nitroreductase family protein n=1 Tax=Massilia sp. H6 TaxID=2970464 RepID=UPI00216857CC|nr:nitroreductase family protein [Massilia sp. H6]UVW29306.1 nitroreductase family protein [Massilia sp. H6]